MLLTSFAYGTSDVLRACQAASVHTVVRALLAGISTCILTYSLYNLFFHPLRSFPGPILWRAFRVPYLVRALQGRLAFDLLGLHKNYGPIVRIAPNELALAFDGVWDKVQGGTYDNEMAKLKPYYRVQASQTDFIMTAPSEDHAQMRRALSHGFSDRGIRDMESRMIAMLDKMLGRLLALCRCRDSMPTDRPARKYEAVIDLAKWCNFLTFDMIGELAFGESYKCLETATYHPWVEPIVQLTHYSGILAVLGFYPTLQALLLSVFGGVISQRMESHQEHSRVALERRAKRPDRTDLLSQSLKQANASKDPLAWDKLVMNASVLGVAGSETTATTITAAFYFLLTNPHAYQQLSSEVRSAFKDEADITITAVNELKYMLACLNESMRMLPAVPGGLPRVVSLGGKVLGGKFVPQGTIVSIWHWALYHNDVFFRNPFEFRPERFLGAADFSSDARQVLQPFHVGRRACIGRSLAYVEMRLTLARLVFLFDMEITDESRDWPNKLRPYNMWYKAPLYVRIKRRKQGMEG